MILAVFFLVGEGINYPLSHQVKMDEVAKNMIRNANSAERNPNALTFTQKNTDHVYILTR